LRFEMHLARPVDPGELVASVATLLRRVISRALTDTAPKTEKMAEWSMAHA
jgi:DNA-binding response OmpR family regulator